MELLPPSLWFAAAALALSARLRSRPRQNDTNRKPLGVVADLDGTLLDTEPLYLEAYNRVLAPFGKAYTDKLRLKVMGRPEPVSYTHLTLPTICSV